MGLAFPLALVVTLATAGVVTLRARKDVTLVVDGVARQTTSTSGTVAELLESEGIEVGRHDKVAPGVQSSLSDGMKIDVLLGRQITLLINGEERPMWATGDMTVEEVLRQINVRAQRGAYIEPSRGATVQDGDVIVYRAAVNVKLTVDGTTREIITNTTDVAGLLDSLGIVMDEDDVASPRVHTDLENGMQVRVTRVEVEQVTESEDVPFGTRVRKTRELTIGTRRVLRAGVPGLVRRTYEVRTEDGEVVRKTLLRERPVRDPRAEVVLEGTRPLRTDTGVASWYDRDGMVAAHPSLPFGTQVKVTNLATGRSVTVVINDRGPYATGRIIDLGDDAFAVLAPLSVGTINVRIAW